MPIAGSIEYLHSPVRCPHDAAPCAVDAAPCAVIVSIGRSTPG